MLRALRKPSGQYPEICVVYVGTPAAASSLTFCLVRWLRIFVSYVSDCLAASSHMFLAVLLQACDRELIILVPLHFGHGYVAAPSAASSLTLCLARLGNSFISYVFECLAPWLHFVLLKLDWVGNGTACSQNNYYVIKHAFGT